MSKKFDELEFKDDFMFSRVMLDKDVCIGILNEIFPEMGIEDVEYPVAQKVIDKRVDAKGIRLDVFTKDPDGNVYDMETQTSIRKELPRRSRYYQGLLDLDLIEKGQKYDKLSNSYIIFICTDRIFDTNYSFYTFRPRCVEHENVVFDAGVNWVFISTKGDRTGLSDNFKALLTYIDTHEIEDNDFVRMIDRRVQAVRESREWRLEYMLLTERDEENKEQGRMEGRSDAKQEIALKMMQDGLPEQDIILYTGIDKDTLMKLREENGLK